MWVAGAGAGVAVKGIFVACFSKGHVLAWLGPGPADAAGGGQDEEPPPVEGALLARLPALAECFEQGRVQDVLAALRRRPDKPWAAEAVQALEKCGPHALHRQLSSAAVNPRP